MPPNAIGSVEDMAPIKVRVTIGPISLDVEDNADKLTLLVTKIVASFIAQKFIGVSAGSDIASELKAKAAA